MISEFSKQKMIQVSHESVTMIKIQPSLVALAKAHLSRTLGDCVYPMVASGIMAATNLEPFIFSVRNPERQNHFLFNHY